MSVPPRQTPSDDHRDPVRIREKARKIHPDASQYLDEMVRRIKHHHANDEFERFLDLFKAFITALEEEPSRSEKLAASLASAVVRLAKYEAQKDESSQSA